MNEMEMYGGRRGVKRYKKSGNRYIASPSGKFAYNPETGNYVNYNSYSKRLERRSSKRKIPKRKAPKRAIGRKLTKRELGRVNKRYVARNKLGSCIKYNPDGTFFLSENYNCLRRPFGPGQRWGRDGNLLPEVFDEDINPEDIEFLPDEELESEEEPEVYYPKGKFTKRELGRMNKRYYSRNKLGSCIYEDEHGDFFLTNEYKCKHRPFGPGQRWGRDGNLLPEVFD